MVLAAVVGAGAAVVCRVMSTALVPEVSVAVGPALVRVEGERVVPVFPVGSGTFDTACLWLVTVTLVCSVTPLFIAEELGVYFTGCSGVVGAIVVLVVPTVPDASVAVVLVVAVV